MIFFNIVNGKYKLFINPLNRDCVINSIIYTVSYPWNEVKNIPREYQICKRCVIDTTDPDIVFDENGYCNHCISALKKLNSYPINLSKEEKEKELQKIVAEVKESGKNKQYDCIVGVNGGVDSSYVLYLVKKRDLRPLAFHLDNE
jgi:uncharacterized protein (UPF0297 family)